MPEISQDYINRRRQRLRNITAPPTRSTSSRGSNSKSSSAVSRPRSQSTPSRRRTTPSPSRTAVSRTSTPIRTPQRTTASRPSTTQVKVHKPSTSGSTVFEKLKPKAGILSLEDFKCIFCFQLPKIPADEMRGIVLCPNCRHPAHADEFKEWAQESPLCSRCDASIPLSFRRNPIIIPVKQYAEAIEEFKRRKS